MKKTTFAILLFSLVSFAVAFSQHRWIHKEVLKYDGSGYYLYLPAVFIYQDLGKIAFYKGIDSLYSPSNDIKMYGLYHQAKTGLVSNKYPIGIAIGELPAFLLAHAYTKLYMSDYPADGYSMPYQFSVAMSNILWTIIGLVVLASFLRHFFSDSIIAFTILIIGFGTNLFCYTSIETGLSHTFAFMLFAFVLYFTQRWHVHLHKKDAILLGVSLGWILISRPIDFLVVLIPIFWPQKHINQTVNNKFTFLRQNRMDVFLAVVAGVLVTSLQIAYWKYTTGNFIHFSYEDEGFNFFKPEIINGLVSYRKGWFVYTPVAFIALLGLIPLNSQQKEITHSILLFFIVFLYFVFSWHSWWYGWGFGARPMIESYSILSLPLAALLFCLREQSSLLRAVGISILLLLITLNIFQTIQFRHGKIDGEFETRETYIKRWKKAFN